MKKLYLIAIVVAVLTAWINVNVIWANENPTRTLYNNKVPYKALFAQHNTNPLKIQVQTKTGKNIQKVVPVVNDVEKDLTQKNTEEKGN